MITSRSGETSLPIPLHNHYQMLQEDARTLGFREAIELVVPEKGHVVELGGGTGVLSFFAAKKAAKVWCVEIQPSLAAKAEELLAKNGRGDIVEVVVEDACLFLPPVPVDTVICEMLHSALLREKQAKVIATFKEGYLKKFGPPLPRFIPEATVLGVEPIERDYDFGGFHAPLPVFQASGDPERTKSLGDPCVYSIVQYRESFFPPFDLSVSLRFAANGNFNALRFVTNNSLAVNETERTSINWRNQNLILPIPSAMTVQPGEEAQVRFAYSAGDEIETLWQSIRFE